MTKDGARRKATIQPAPGAPAGKEAAPLALGPLPGYTGYVLRRAQVALFENFINTFKPLGLRPAQFSVLLVVNANPGRRQSEIAAALGIRQANLVGLIDELDRRGLTKRKRLAADRRSHALTLTAKGKALLKTALAMQARFEQHLVAELGANEHARLIAALVKLYQVMTKLNSTAPDGLIPARRRPRKTAKPNGRSRAALHA
ncbi:MAG: MarR family winged helix-turn-helix transcriptional regulator [Rhodoplanes sp.]|jgi:DNA-binding MarR family transcriptional regulator